MSREECQRLIDAYVEWLRGGLSAESVEAACELTTPFLDHLQIYAERRNGTIILSDDGYVLSDLRTSGTELNTPKRQEAFEAILNGFGVRLEGNELMVEASERTLGQRLHALVQAMLAVSDMFLLAEPRVATFFFEDVRHFLDAHDVRYTERVKIAGRSGFDHLIDFLVPRSRERPERLIQAINAPARTAITPHLFGLTDMREARDRAWEAYAFLNDRDRGVGGDVVEALDSYSVTAVPWSQREEHVAELAS